MVNICAYPTSLKVGDIVTFSERFPGYWKRNIKYKYRKVVAVSDDLSLITIDKPVNTWTTFRHDYFKLSIKELRKLKLKKIKNNGININ